MKTLILLFFFFFFTLPTYNSIKTACIREYGSTLYVGIGHVQNGRLYLRYGTYSDINIANLATTLTDESLCYSIVKKVLRV